MYDEKFYEKAILFYFYLFIQYDACRCKILKSTKHTSPRTSSIHKSLILEAY
jgi:hypothetical protein